MKYSQAVLVACIGGATLASAIPTIGHNAGTPAAASRAERYGNRVGKGIAHFRQFADKASGMSTSSNDQSGSSFKRRNLATTPAKLGGHGAKRAKAKAFAKAAVAGAGGATELAHGLGSVYHFAKQNLGSDRVVARGLTNTETPASIPPSAAQPMSPTAKTPSSHVGGGHHHNGGGRRQRKKKHASAAAPPGASAEKSGPASPAPVPLSSRDFEEDLWLRAFDDLKFLSSRGPTGMQAPESATPLDAQAEEVPASATSSAPSGAAAPTVKTPGHHRGGHCGHRGPRRKGSKHQNYKHAKAATPHPASSEGSVPASPAPAAPVSSRDFEEDIWARDLDDVGFLSSRALAATQATSKGAKHSAGPVEGSHPVPSVTPREFEDFSHLNARDFEETLEARGAWSKVKNAVGALKDTVLGKQSGSAGMPTGASDPAMAMAKRDYIENLDARDLDFKIDELD